MTMYTPRSGSIRSHLQRPKVSFNLDGEMSGNKENDPLPIVELKPFVNKVWRREKSLPGFYDKYDVSLANSRTTPSSRNKDIETISEISQEDTAPISPPPRTAQSLPTKLPSQRLVHLYVNTFNDFKSQKEHINNLIGESGFRPKSRIHPLADSKTVKQLEHSVSVIQGFITRDDRTFTTLNEISEGERISRTYSCSPKTVGPIDIKRDQQMEITGDSLNPNIHTSKQTSGYVTPVKNVNVNWHGPGVHHGSPASFLYYNKLKDPRIKRPKTPIYDHMDRKGALPSLTVNAKSLKTRCEHRHDNASVSEDYSDYRDTYDRNLKHKVGGIENAFHVLSKHGPPTKVERNISFELEINLSRFRKSKEYSPFEINPSELAKYIPQPVFNMTQGEALIRQGLQSNASKRRRNYTRSNGTVPKISSKQHMSTLESTHFPKTGMKKRFGEMDHIDSYGQSMFDLSYQKHERVNFDVEKTITTDEELMVPHDTPRSQIDSRISLKATDMVINEAVAKRIDEKVEVCDKATDVDSNCSENVNKTKVFHEIPSEKRSTPHNDRHGDSTTFDNMANKTEPMQLVNEPNSGLPEKEPDGRTFITSDNLITGVPVSVTG